MTQNKIIELESRYEDIESVKKLSLDLSLRVLKLQVILTKMAENLDKELLEVFYTKI